jgi:hypothetical protein
MMTKDSHGSQQTQMKKKIMVWNPEMYSSQRFILDFTQRQFQQTNLTLKKLPNYGYVRYEVNPYLSIQIKLKDVQP